MLDSPPQPVRHDAGLQTALVIDNDPQVVASLALTLRRGGWAVVAAPSGVSALALARTQRFDVILSDLRLGDMTGVDVLRRLPVTNKTAWFVILTGNGSVRSAVEALRAGANDYLEKPIHARTLLRALEEHGRTGTPVLATPHPCVAGLEHAEAALRVIERRYRESGLSQSVVADDLGISPEHLSRLLRKHAGRSYPEHLHAIRIAEAGRLLLETHLSIKEIAIRCGYASTSELDRHFKDLRGCVPVAYRRGRVEPSGDRQARQHSVETSIIHDED